MTIRGLRTKTWPFLSPAHTKVNQKSAQITGSVVLTDCQLGRTRETIKVVAAFGLQWQSEAANTAVGEALGPETNVSL
jgi:hypothetical protein